MEVLCFTLVLNLDEWLVTRACDDLERPELDVLLNSLVLELATDQSLGIEHSVVRVSRNLVLGSISNETL